MSYESARQSKCTTAPVSVDLSMYWTPQLYYYNPANQTYQAIPLGYFNAYYLPRSNGKGEKVHAFPDGLRMIAGDPFRRVDEGKGYTSMVCQDYYHNHQGDPNWDQRSTFFKQNCPNGMRAQVSNRLKRFGLIPRSTSRHAGTAKTLTRQITNRTWHMLAEDRKVEETAHRPIPSTL